MLQTQRLRALTIALTFVLASLLPAMPAQAQSLGVTGLWANVLTTSASGRGFEPEVAYDRQGFLHLVFFGGPTQDEWGIYYTNNRGGSFLPPRLISEASGEQRSPDIAIGGDGHIHVIYEKRSITHIYYVESPDLGTTWLKPVDLTKYDTKAYEPSVAVDANNTVHAVFTDRHWAGDQQTTYARRAPGGSWFGPVRVSANTFDRYPDVTTSGSGPNARAHIVYQGRARTSLENGDFDVLLVNVVGERIQAPINVSNDANVWSLEPAVASDGGDELYLAWDKQVNGSHDIVFARSTNLGQTWTEPRDLARRPATAASPAIAFGRSGGVPRVHIAWDEGGAAIYALYEPATNTFGDALEQVSPQRNAQNLSVAASDTVNQVANAYQGSNLAALAVKTPGIPLAATLRLNGGQSLTISRALSVTLGNLRGGPTQMRYAFGRAPDDSDPWLPVQAQFDVMAPAQGQCTQTFNLQLRAADGRRSPVLSAQIVVDDAVQAAVTMENPYLSGLPLVQSEVAAPIEAGSPAYTRERLFQLSIADGGDCSGLTRFTLGDTSYPIAGGYRNLLPLPGPSADGPRPVAVQVLDAAGNAQTYSSTITLDRQPPQVLSGTLAVDGPPTNLPSVLATLVVSGAIADNLYPGGYWGALIANTSDPALPDEDPSLQWRALALPPAGDRFSVRGWNVLAGLSTSPNDQSLVGKPIEVRLKLLDGAGNPSPQTLTTTVTLAPDYKPLRAYLAMMLR